jgi:hypothetical protein
MNIIHKARKLESRIARTVDRAAQRFVKPGAREPLEIVHAIVERVEHEVQPAGRGGHVFPFNRIKASVVSASHEARARFEAVLNGEPSLRARIVSRLESAGCEVSDLVVKVVYVPQPRPDWHPNDCHVEFERVTPAVAATIGKEPPLPPPLATRISLTVLTGAAEQPDSSFAQQRINLGRCPEVRDHRNRLLRINHVAFADSDAPVNQSVSRCHAHVEFIATTRQYRVYDDHSKQGTALLRDGRTIEVPPGPHGVGLQPGDEILLGEARLRFTHRPASDPAASE